MSCGLTAGECYRNSTFNQLLKMKKKITEKINAYLAGRMWVHKVGGKIEGGAGFGNAPVATVTPI